MRDRAKTIESLRRLAERPGTPQEGETARRKLREMEAQQPKSTPKEQVLQGMRYVSYKGEFDIDALKEILGVKTANRKKKPVVTWEDMEGCIRRNIYRDQGDID